MRARAATLVPALALSLAACASGRTTYVRVQDPVPPPTRIPVSRPVPLPEPIEPLQITLGRPVRGKVLLQTNRPAYVAIFEVLPEHGVRLVYPSSAQQGPLVLSGLSALPVWWSAQRVPADSRSAAEGQPTRYIYAVASDEPLRLPDEAFHAGYLQWALGPRDYQATSPYATMRALSRHFVPNVADEEWAEDAYALMPTPAAQPQPVARIYCPNGTTFEVPAEIADRALCPSSTRGFPSDPNRPHIGDEGARRRQPTRPDSILGDNGRHIRARAPQGRGPIIRVSDPAAGGNNGHAAQGGGETKEHPVNQGDTGRGHGQSDDASLPHGRGIGPHGRDEPSGTAVSKPGNAGWKDNGSEPRDGVRSNPHTLIKPPTGATQRPGSNTESRRDSTARTAPVMQHPDSAMVQPSGRPDHRMHQREKPTSAGAPVNSSAHQVDSSSVQPSEPAGRGRSAPADELKPGHQGRGNADTTVTALPASRSKGEHKGGRKPEAASKPVADSTAEQDAGHAKDRGGDSVTAADQPDSTAAQPADGKRQRHGKPELR